MLTGDDGLGSGDFGSVGLTWPGTLTSGGFGGSGLGGSGLGASGLGGGSGRGSGFLQVALFFLRQPLLVPSESGSPTRPVKASKMSK